MVRMKVYLVFLALIVAAGVVVAGSFGDLRDEAVAERRAGVEHAKPAAAAAMSLARTWLHDATTDFSRSVIPAYLKTLEEFRGKLTELERELYADESVSDHQDPEQQKAREDIVRGRTELLDSFAEALIKNIDRSPGKSYWKGRDQEKFKAKAKEDLADCASYAVNNCMFKFTYESLNEYIDESQGGDNQSVKQIDLFLIVDAKGTGLADSANEKWSDAEDFAKQVPLLQKALVEWSSPMDVYYQKRTQKAYLAKAQTLRHGRTRVGAVLVGIELDESFARGVEGVARLDVLVVSGDRVVAATVEAPDLVQGVKQAVAGGRTDAVLQGGAFAFMVMPLVEGSSGPASHLVLANKLTVAAESFGSSRATVLLVLLALFLVGLLLFEWHEKILLSGFEGIDQGVHEIIAGNSDYEFLFVQGRKDVANSMAQSLNLMLALLLGRPLPQDEEEMMMNWADMGLDEEAAQQAVRRADTDARMLAAEAADAYYKRIYQEYMDAKRSVGTPEDDLTYVKFVEKVARIERRLKEQHGASVVRFAVTVEGGKVTLSPIFVDQQ
jgi:hypothetical protein